MTDKKMIRPEHLAQYERFPVHGSIPELKKRMLEDCCTSRIGPMIVGGETLANQVCRKAIEIEEARIHSSGHGSYHDKGDIDCTKVASKALSLLGLQLGRSTEE